ncbi:MAG TPA: 50S ribosomal protein L11 methyltransferase [Chitinophagaceae bacterium]|nr:MAG: (LSU ribosomal protein L11P)-lysine N-methyltransferase [Bacteroidetes bacterium OLB11]HMN32965.1 50S ribosomal protein L11 methyltransferase [Chitinophagaceae bacterium]
MNTIKIKFINIDEQKSDLIIALLSDMPVQGFDYEELHLQAYFLENDFHEEQIQARLKELEVEFSKEIIATKNWNEEWENNFNPIFINDEIAIKAPFHDKINGVKHVINIMPKMSFGTGHHATTQLMLQMMSSMKFENKSVFDFGCGTGVLSIYAEIKNATSVLGIDNDEWSVENAIENYKMNDCHKIEISNQSIETIDKKFDIILANIQLNILVQYKEKLKELLSPSGIILLSGVLVSDEAQLRQAFEASQFQLIERAQIKEWIALKMINQI